MPSPASGLRTRQLLVEAAQNFLGEGKSDFTIQQVAEAAGISVGSLYTHFADRNALIVEAAKQAYFTAFSGWMAAIQATVPNDLPLGAVCIAAHVGNHPERDPRLAQIVLASGIIGWAQSPERLSALTETFATAAAKGEITCDDPEAFTIALSGAYQYVMAHYVAGTASEDLAERTMWLFAKELGYSKAQFESALIGITRVLAETNQGQALLSDI